MNKEIQSRVVDFHGRKYIASRDFWSITNRKPQPRPRDALIVEGKKYVSLEYFEFGYYKVPLTDRKYMQVMGYYTDTFGECTEFVWVDFIKAAKLFILKHCHWDEFKAYQDFIPYRIPEKVTYGDLAEFDIPGVFATQLAKRQNSEKRGLFNDNCTKAFDRPVDDTI